MEFLVLGLIGIGAYVLFRASDFETVGGVRHFTAHGQAAALKALQNVSVHVSSVVVDGGATFVLVQQELAGLSGLATVQAAEANGGIVLLSESVLDTPIGALLVVTSRGSEKAIAVPGSGLAVLTTVSG